ncbi:MAG: hypothetical protein E1N59_600 [Puniceicoccaceae bacterium 5H]|nr:MAG: hypothetical protein E1N59_600 [Puniceicoccaceae bacterium 5H]
MMRFYVLVLAMICCALALKGGSELKAAIGSENEDVASISFRRLLEMKCNGDFGKEVEIEACISYTGVEFRLFPSECASKDRQIAESVILGFDVNPDPSFDEIQAFLEANKHCQFRLQGKLEDHSPIGMGVQFTAIFIGLPEEGSNAQDEDS